MITVSKSNQEEEIDLDADGVEEPKSDSDKYMGVIIAFTGAWAFAICSVFNRKLKEINFQVLMVYHGMIGGILASVFILIEGAINGGFRWYTGT